LSPVTTLIDIKVDANSMSHGYDSWWRVGTPEVSLNKAVLEANESLVKEIHKVRQF
jgi:3D-(3,5/4)-trihydroxycyclohexane-1,2-dione acylhydrolase (decyclizing)